MFNSKHYSCVWIYLVLAVEYTNSTTTTEIPSSGPLVTFEELQLTEVEEELESAAYIREDRINPGSFIIANQHALQFLSSNGNLSPFVGEPKETHVINGIGTEAKFGSISSFVQFNDEEILVTEIRSSCIRHVNRTSAEVTYKLGECGRAAETPQSGTMNASEVKFKQPSQIRYLEEENRFYILDFGFSMLYEYNPVNQTITVVFSEKEKCKESYGFLFSSDKKLIYISHLGGISTFNRATHQIKLVVGNTTEAESDETKHKFRDGTLKTARFGTGSHIEWIIEDQILVMAGYDSKALRIINLVDERVDDLCKKDYNAPKTDTARINPGSLAVCQLDASYSVAVINNTIFVGARYGPSHSRRGAFVHIKYHVPQCMLNQTNSSIVIDPVKPFYQHLEKITFRCPTGKAIRGVKTLTCVRSNDTQTDTATGVWDHTFPVCGFGKIDKVRPLEGRSDGGTLITVSSEYVLENISIDVKNGYSISTVEIINKREHEVQFRMLNKDQDSSSPTQILIRYDLDNKVPDEIYNYTYLPDPTLTRPPNRNNAIYSGGQTMIFSSVTHIQSSSDYKLNIKHNQNIFIQDCTIVPYVHVVCVLPSLNETNPSRNPARRRRQASGLNIVLSANLTADGIPVRGDDAFTLTYYPDPKIPKVDGTLEIEEGEVIKLAGEHLADGLIESDYKITLEGDKLESIESCDITKLTNEIIICAPALKPSSTRVSRLRTIKVTISGGKEYSPGSVKLVPGTETGSIKKPADFSDYWWILLIILVLILIVVAVLVVLYLRRRGRSRRTPPIHVTGPPVFGSDEHGKIIAQIPLEIKIRLDDISIKPEDLSFNPTSSPAIGQGHFGNVYLGQLRCNQGETQIYRTVAVKSMKATQDIDLKMIQDFLEEACFLVGYHHMNVLTTIGVVWRPGDRPTVVLPFMAMGDLLRLIRKPELTFTNGDLLHFGLQVASGMEYLSLNKFVHRDLAARNVLVGDNFLCKIADFGMSRDTYEHGYYREGSVGKPKPIRWMALESLREARYSTESDVWSFGVLLWELQTRGGQPYPGIENEDIQSYLTRGQRLEKPEFTHPVVFNKMYLCWDTLPPFRPKFKDLHEFLKGCLHNYKLKPENVGIDERDKYYHSYDQMYTAEIPTDYLTNSEFLAANDKLYDDKNGKSLRQIYAQYGLSLDKDEDPVDYRTMQPAERLSQTDCVVTNPMFGIELYELEDNPQNSNGSAAQTEPGSERLSLDNLTNIRNKTSDFTEAAPSNQYIVPH